MDQFISVVFLLACLGVINSFLLAIILVIPKDRTVANIYFSGLLLALCFRIGKSVFLHFYDDVGLLILQIGLSACIFIGPFFYFFLKAEIRGIKTILKLELWILLSLLLGIVIVGVIYPYQDYPGYWNQYIIRSIYLVWLFFVGLGVWEGKHLIFKMIKTPRKLKTKEVFLLGVICGLTFITFSFQYALFISGITYIWGAIGFTFFFYTLFLLEIKNRFWKRKTVVQTIPLEEGKRILKRIDQLMEEEGLYKNPKLKLDHLAKYADVSKHQLSKVLNEVYPNGFSHYVNEWRIKEAKHLIKIKQELSLEGIGYDSGFNSKSSFFSTFKKMTSFTPAQFKKSLEESS